MRILTPSPRRARAGFSLIELVVVILIMTILAGVVVPKVSVRRAAARDARRLTDVHAIADAIEHYKLENGEYPPSSGSPWEMSSNGNFLAALVEKGYLRDMPADPTNDATYHYRYQRYNEGQNGCVGSGPYFVLGVRSFELNETAAANTGYFQCTGHDWTNDFDFVIGGGASLR
jgi:general secretion pathway protein G